MKVKEFIKQIEEQCSPNKTIRFHTSDRMDLEFLSVYVSDDKKYLEIDIGNCGE